MTLRRSDAASAREGAPHSSLCLLATAHSAGVAQLAGAVNTAPLSQRLPLPPCAHSRRASGTVGLSTVGPLVSHSSTRCALPSETAWLSTRSLTAVRPPTDALQHNFSTLSDGVEVAGSPLRGQVQCDFTSRLSTMSAIQQRNTTERPIIKGILRCEPCQTLKVAPTKEQELTVVTLHGQTCCQSDVCATATKRRTKALSNVFLVLVLGKCKGTKDIVVQRFEISA